MLMLRAYYFRRARTELYLDNEKLKNTALVAFTAQLFAHRHALRATSRFNHYNLN
jgi:hypothetical protein